MLTAVLGARGQQLWTSADVEKNFGKKWGVGVEVEYRTHDRLKSTERVTFSASGEYKHRYFKVDAGYKFMMNHSETEYTKKGNVIPPYWIDKHRAWIGATGKLKLGRFELSLRERYQFTHRDGKTVPKFASDGITPKPDEVILAKDKHILRSRIACDWNIRKSPFTPFASVELYDNLGYRFDLEKVRYTVGSEYKINKKNRVELFYRYVQGCSDKSDKGNVIGVGYSFRL